MTEGIAILITIAIIFILLVFFLGNVILDATGISDKLVDMSDNKRRLEDIIKNNQADYYVTFEQFISMYNIHPELITLYSFSFYRTDNNENVMSRKNYSVGFKTVKDGLKYIRWKKKYDKAIAQSEKLSREVENTIKVKEWLEDDIRYAQERAEECYKKSLEIKDEIERRQNDTCPWRK